MSPSKPNDNKLLVSVRKTKTTASVAAKTTKKNVAKKTGRVTKKKVSSNKAARQSTQRNKHLQDLFQSGRRVWPD